MNKNQLHKLLTFPQEKGLLQNLDLTKNDEERLISARDEIIAVISQGFKDARAEVERKGLGYEVPLPRFAMQGSYVYKTLNAPAYPPNQQVDIDLGVYMPFSALGNGEAPSYATENYFGIVTEIMRKHIDAKRKGQWELVTDKDTCIRVQISNKTHIDLPLYATPEKVFNQVKDEHSRALILNEAEKALFKSMSTFDQEATIVERVDPSEIHLAHKKEGWKPSNALAIRDWVKASCKAKGMNNQVRAVCRYLKAWRDEKWQSGGGPSSIFLLAFVLRAYKHTSSKHCELLEAVISELPNVFKSPLLIPCPTPGDRQGKEDLRERVDPDQKAEYLAAFNDLKYCYLKARQNVSPADSNKELIGIFGDRVPFEPGRIEQNIDSNESKAASTVKRAERRVEPLVTEDASTSG